MSTELRTKSVSTLREFTDLIEECGSGGDVTLWYRGCGSSSYALIPRLYRHPTKTGFTELMKLESSIIARFKQRSVPYLTHSISGDWEFLFLMQHYGVPTRLLDWTESPFISLYFAITDALSAKPAQDDELSQDATVWILNPIDWNRQILQHLSYKEGILSLGDSPLTGYDSKEQGPTNKEAVALYGSHNSPRIVAQRGAFTIFGQNTDPLEKVFRNGNFAPDSLVKVILPHESLRDLANSVFAIGVTDSVVWPDLDGLAKEIKRQFGYGV